MPVVSKPPSEIFWGKVERIASPNQIDILVDLSWGVRLIKTIRLSYTKTTDYMDKAMVERARRCLIILCGGKNVLFKAEDRNRKGILEEELYLNEPVKEVAGCMELVDGRVNLLNISKFMERIAAADFSQDVVYTAFYGKKDV